MLLLVIGLLFCVMLMSVCTAKSFAQILFVLLGFLFVCYIGFEFHAILGFLFKVAVWIFAGWFAIRFSLFLCKIVSTY